MKNIFLVGLFAMLTACAQVDKQPASESHGSHNPRAAMTGPQVVSLLTTYYNRKFTNCNNSANQPAFLCSGIIFRVTKKNPGETHHVWNPSPTSVKNGGVSFSFLRTDSKFGRLAWGHGNGYMVYPILDTPAPNKVDLDILCSFPIDGWTWNRTTPCGHYVSYPDTSKRCQSAGVASVEQWKTRWDTFPNAHHLRQCGFDVSEATGKPAAAPFYESVRARGMLSQNPTHFVEQNEIVASTWPQNQQDIFPLMAFFFVAGGSNAGLAEAQGNQKDFYDSTTARLWVPVIRLFPPSTVADQARFEYVEADQLVKP
ncbi:halovibrin HvnC [Pseudomonas sp. SWRI99]|uniref:halovibrin HvnC n=1 Tax=Pseudomonas sp. SWRI99 TaxID=2745506 RepID=UPI0016459716|nr:halovibrin HvnC [Pseudomonas sp. SWRI99]MBC3778301.1 halovibrin HvnC [Pseudomonas sp. SWRI99]